MNNSSQTLSAKKKIIAIFSLSVLIIGCGEGALTKTQPPPPIPVQPMPLNDTGVTGFINESNTLDLNGESSPILLSLEPIDFPGQDGGIGRDALNPDAIDGTAGFSFSKLDKNSGVILAANSLEFGCVKDEVTGLIWENKVKSVSNLHSSTAKHTWYNPDQFTNGGVSGQQASDSACATAVNDTYNFVQEVNRENLCGFNNWRIPTAEELRSLIDYSVTDGSFAKPMVDVNFFPLIANTLHRWTSQTYGSDPKRAYGFHFHEGRMQSHEKQCTATNQGSYHNGTILVSGVYGIN